MKKVRGWGPAIAVIATSRVIGKPKTLPPINTDNLIREDPNLDGKGKKGRLTDAPLSIVTAYRFNAARIFARWCQLWRNAWSSITNCAVMGASKLSENGAA